MRRRRLLAALSLLPAAVAGCGGRTDPPTPARTRTPTPADTATAIGETTPLPDPPDSPTPEDALAFVREYERAAATNRIVREGGTGPARNPEVGEPKAVLAVDADEGFYLFGACRARATYEGGRGFGVNRHEVPHFVGRDGSHEVAPWSAVVCDAADRPYAAADASENAVVPGEESGAEIHLFRFDGAERAVEVAVDYLDDGPPRRVFSTTVDADSDAPDPAYDYALSNVAVRRGRYRVHVDVPEAESADRDAVATWTLGDPEAPSWTGLSVFVGDDGRPHVGLADAEDGSLVPGPSGCFRYAQSRGED